MPDNRTYSLEGLPPLPLPPVVPPIPGAFANDAVYYVVDCEVGTMPEYSGTLPAWITIDEANNRLVGAAGTFRGNTKALANAAAQSALDSFGAAALEAGTLTCVSGCAEAIVVGTGGGWYPKFLNSMAVNGSDAVAVGYQGAIVSSTDGLVWTDHSSGAITFDLFGVTYGNGAWIAVGDQAVIYRSTDMTTWVDVSVVTSDDLLGVAFGSGVFVTADTAGRIYRSPDGITWTLITTFGGEIFYNLTFGGGLFVGVGAGGFIATSPDGLTWTERTSGVVADLFDVAYNDSQYVAISANTATVIYSSNAVTWQSTSIVSSDFDLYSIASGDGLFVVVTQDSGQVWVSTDGQTWTRQMPDLCPNVVMVDYYTACQFNVSLPYNGTECSGVSISTDVTSPQFIFDAVVVDNHIVVVGNNDLARTSDNSFCWTNHSSGFPNGTVAVDHGNGVYLTAGYVVGLTAQAATSPDGATWTLQPSFGSGFSRPSGVRFGHGIFVLGIEDTGGGTPPDLGQIWTSINGVAWTFRAGATGGISFVALGNGIFIAGIRATGKIIRSTDGITWSAPITVAGGATSFGYAAYGNGVWVMSSDDPNTFYRSTDQGLTWSSVAMADDANAGPDFGNGYFLVQLADSKFYTSTDGSTWTLHSTGSTLYTTVHFYKNCSFMAIR